MSAPWFTIELYVGETVVKRFSPPEPTNVVGMTWRFLMGKRGDTATESKTDGDGLTVTGATGDVDVTIDATDTASPAEFDAQLERTNAGAVRVTAVGRVIVMDGVRG